MEEQIVQKKKGNGGLIITFIIILLIAVAGSCFGGWYYGKMNADEVIAQKIECEKELKESKTESTVEKAKCYGTYIESGTQGQVKWILKEDGTFKVEDSGGLRELSGAFFIKDNTITFIEQKHTVGPEDQDPYYTNPQISLISKDCKKIQLAPEQSIGNEIGAPDLTKQD